MTEPFKKLTEKDVSVILGKLSGHLPGSYHALSFVKQIMTWKEKNPDLVCGVYSPDGDYSDSTVLIILKFNGECMSTYYSSTETGSQRLNDALLKTRLFEGDTSILMTAIPDWIHKIVSPAWCKLSVDHETPCHLYSLSPQAAMDLSTKCPEDVYLSSLKEEDAELVDLVWPHRTSRSVHLIKEIIRTSYSVGLYRKDTHQLLSWALRWFYGGVGAVQTVAEAKRRGYAQLVVSALSQKLAADEWPIHLTVVVGNFESTPLFMKMGFERHFLCHYIEYK